MSNKYDYPDEVYEFIKENFSEYGLTLLPILNEKFGINMSKKNLSYCAYSKLGLKSHFVNEYCFTKEEEDWLVRNAFKYKSLNEIKENFNSVFPRIKRSKNAIAQKLDRLSIKIQKVDCDEIDWLRKNAPYHSSSELAEMHNEVFEKKRSYAGIYRMATKNKIKILSDKDAYFEHWHKSSKITRDIGSTHHAMGGKEFVKVANNDSQKRLKRNEMWILRSRYEYERQYGIKPKRGEVVIHLDGDRTNYSKENLYLAPNYINGYILWYLGNLIKDQPELNKAHILRFEVEKAIKDYEKENKDFKKWRKNMNEHDPTNEGVNE